MSIGQMLRQDHSSRVLLWGMSCAGKTTFAQTMTEHAYMCFDALFNWHLIETVCLPIDTQLKHISALCDMHPKFVIDGWHLSDKRCELSPPDTTAYVIYDDYESIIRRYRVPVSTHMEHFHMFKRWYDLELSIPVRFFKNGDIITETDFGQFKLLLERNQ